MDIFAGLLINVLEEGFIYGIMALGVYITYTVLDFPDLSVDGTFPLGACLAAVMVGAGANPWLACLAAFVCGALAGCATGLLHVRFGITDLLSGILVMTGLLSVNLVISGGSAVLPFYDKPTVFTSGPAAPLLGNPLRIAVVAGVVCLAVKLLLDAYLRTKNGLLLRAAGDNPQFVTSLGRDPGKMKILGLAIGNGCTALSGCILAQQSEAANVTGGTGMVVMALASVIIGVSLFKRLPFVKPTLAVIFGAILYKACLVIAMQLGLPTNYLKLLMAVIFTVVLVSNKAFGKKRRKQHVDPARL